jgi:membrane dipeptidase
MYAENPQLAKLGYPRPPWDSLAPEMLPELVEGLLRLGWSDADVKGLLGGNFLRVARRVWR